MIDLEQRIAELINDSMRTTPYAEASLGWKMTCVNTAKAIIGATMIDRTYELEEALQRIKQWCDAYPPNIFTPISDERLKEIAEVLGNDMDKLHAQWARHILQGIGEIVDSVLSHKGN